MNRYHLSLKCYRTRVNIRMYYKSNTILNMKFVLILLTGFLTEECFGGVNKLQEKYYWTQIDFSFANENARREALDSRQFIPENNVPFGVEVWKDKVFVTIPRRNPGVLATLNYFDLNGNKSSPLLIPYPDFDSNKPTVGHITSAYRTNSDTCDRLWTFDTGSVVDFERNVRSIQSPRILIFDLNTHTVIKSHQLNSPRDSCNPGFINIIPDLRGSCDDAYAYAVNPASNELLVYSLKDDKSWKKTYPYFFPDPFQMDHTIGDLKFQWTDGLFGFALSELNKRGERNAYMHPMSSLNEFVVDTTFLRDPNATLQGRVKIAAVRDATFQAAAAAYDEKSGVLFYSLVSKNGIGCWNARDSRDKRNNMDIVAADDKTMVYLSDVKVDRNGNLWAINNRLPVLLYGNEKPKAGDIRFRIFTAPIKQAIKNTRCYS